MARSDAAAVLEHFFDSDTDSEELYSPSSDEEESENTGTTSEAPGPSGRGEVGVAMNSEDHDAIQPPKEKSRTPISSDEEE